MPVPFLSFGRTALLVSRFFHDSHERFEGADREQNVQEERVALVHALSPLKRLVKVLGCRTVLCYAT